jgi:hypothetical protein
MSIDQVVQSAATKPSRPAWPAGPDGYLAAVGRINPGSVPPGSAYGMS